MVHKTCNLCEAMCGLRIHVDGGRVGRIEPDPDDPLSRGAICAKAVALREIHEDPDRLRQPLRRQGERFVPVSWDSALSEACERLGAIQKQHGDDAVACYLGNPGAHSLGIVLAVTPLFSVLDTRNRYSASSLDQNPKHASSLLLLGNFLRIPIPDVDRTQHLLMLGANPVVSGGSLMTAPGFRRRLEALSARGGRFVVVDPRRTETAQYADEYLSIQPGKDGLLMAGLLFTVLNEELEGGTVLAERGRGLDDLRRALAPFAPEEIEPVLGIPATTVRRLAREFAAAPSAVCYGRVGTCQHPFGTLVSWLIDVLNLVTGNFDRPGGVMFPRPAVDLAELAEMRGRAGTMLEGHTRVRGAPIFNGDAPTPCLAEEIETPGEGQVRGLLSIAGNPVLSAPNGRRLERALAGLECFVAVDYYCNETTRHAHLILPPTGSLEHDAYEVLFHGFAVRDTARYSPQVVTPDPATKDDFAILCELVLGLAAEKAQGPRRWLWSAARRWLPRPGTRRILDALIRLGPRGDGFRPWRRGLRLADIEAEPSGLDLGPLVPRLDEVLATEDGRIDLAPEVMRAELARLAHDLESRRNTPEPTGLVMIGRRDVRTNNSWLHNTCMSTKGPERCTLQMHPDDARDRGLVAGQRVRVAGPVGAVEAPLELSDRLRPGVVSLPHGWGHGRAGTRLALAADHAGVSCNDVIDDAVLEPVVGNAILNGVPVEVSAVPCAETPSAPAPGVA